MLFVSRKEHGCFVSRKGRKGAKAQSVVVIFGWLVGGYLYM